MKERKKKIMSDVNNSNGSKIIVDGVEVSLEQFQEIDKNKSVKLKLNEDGSYTTLKRLND